MPNSTNEEIYAEASPAATAEPAPAPAANWARMGLVAGASALAGVLAAAWFYRKTLNRLRQAEPVPEADARAEEFEE